MYVCWQLYHMIWQHLKWHILYKPVGWEIFSLYLKQLSACTLHSYTNVYPWLIHTRSSKIIWTATDMLLWLCTVIWFWCERSSSMPTLLRLKLVYCKQQSQQLLWLTLLKFWWSLLFTWSHLSKHANKLRVGRSQQLNARQNRLKRSDKIKC